MKTALFPRWVDQIQIFPGSASFLSDERGTSLGPWVREVGPTAGEPGPK